MELHNPRPENKTTDKDGPFEKRNHEVNTGSITVNGVKSEDILKRKRYQEDKNIKDNTIKKTPRRKNMKTTTPSSEGKVNTMKRYVVKTDSVDRKKEDNIPSEDNLIFEDKTDRQEPASLSPKQHHGVDTQNSVDMKLTFKTTIRKKTNVMSDKISRFQELVDKSQVCVTGSGRCASHNMKLVREIIQKKQSFVKKCGGIGWRFCDFTTLVCPTKLSAAPDRVTIDDIAMTAPAGTGGKTNQITELSGSEASNQSPAGPKKMRDNT